MGSTEVGDRWKEFVRGSLAPIVRDEARISDPESIRQVLTGALAPLRRAVEIVPGPYLVAPSVIEGLVRTYITTGSIDPLLEELSPRG